MSEDALAGQGVCAHPERLQSPHAPRSQNRTGNLEAAHQQCCAYSFTRQCASDLVFENGAGEAYVPTLGKRG